jgi:hypothetical protein
MNFAAPEHIHPRTHSRHVECQHAGTTLGLSSMEGASFSPLALILLENHPTLSYHVSHWNTTSLTQS